LKGDELQAVATYLLSTVKGAAPESPVAPAPSVPEKEPVPAPEVSIKAPAPAPVERGPEAFDPWSESMEEWKHRILNTSTDKFTIQVEISKRRSAILKDLQQLLPEFDAMVIPYRVQSYDAYTLVVGIYDSRAEGNAAVERLPEAFRKLGPLVKTMPTIQKGLTPLGVAPRSGETSAVSRTGWKSSVSPAQRAASAPRDDHAVLVAEGKKIFEEVCTTCHRFDSKLVGPPLMAVLPNYEDRIGELKAFIQNPTKKNPDYPAMMNLGLAKEKVLAVATYLISTLPTAKAPQAAAPAKPAREVPPAPKIERKVATAASSPSVIVIDRVQKKMAPVAFQHAEHQKRTNHDCTVCHHTAKPGDGNPAPCSECHGKEDGALGFKAVMHKSCQDCHKKLAAEGKQPPTTCMGCHKK
ncbi:MAG: cytochrome c3 family protein, partial [bacterium]|nr:cytochrome c3 family protein [bacterium]